MSLYDIALLVSAGLLAGAINALAGGGTIFTFSALMAVGLPPVAANATSAFSVLPGQIAAALAYRDRVGGLLMRIWPSILVSAGAGAAGGWLLLTTDSGVFERLVPFLILFATLLYVASPKIADLGERLAADGPSRTRRASALGLQGIVSLYGGYFGAGLGIMMLATLSLSQGRDYHQRNAAKNLLASFIKLLAVAVFVVSGAVHWAEAAILAAAAIAGGWASVAVGRLVPQSAIRVGVILFGFGLSGWYFYDTFA